MVVQSLDDLDYDSALSVNLVAMRAKLVANISEKTPLKTSTGEPPELEDAGQTSNNLFMMWLTFFFMGVCATVLWNQLLLSSEALILLFGNSALTHACFAYNFLSMVTMIVLTRYPLSIARSTRIAASACAYFAMILVGIVLIQGFMAHSLSLLFFCTIVALLGILTGFVQLETSSLAGLISESKEEADGALGTALLLGNGASPLVTAGVFVAVQFWSRESAADSARCFEESVVTLWCAMVLLLLSVLVTLRLGVTYQAQQVLMPIGICVSSKAGVIYYDQVCHRLRPIGAAIIVVATVWIYLVCEFPYVADGLCGGTCAHLPSLMIAAANIAACVGRLFANYLPAKYLLTETAIFAVVGFVVIHVAERTAVAAPIYTAVTLAGLLVLWGNALLMRLFSKAQFRMDASDTKKCAITSQVTWACMQIGSVLGTALAFLPLVKWSLL